MLYFRDTKVQAIGSLLNEARQFAYGLLQNWNMGRCQEDIVILYARDNNIVILICVIVLSAIHCFVYFV